MPVLKTITTIIRRSVFIVPRWGKVWHSMPLLSSAGCLGKARAYYHDHFANEACTSTGLNLSSTKIGCPTIQSQEWNCVPDVFQSHSPPSRHLRAEGWKMNRFESPGRIQTSRLWQLPLPWFPTGHMALNQWWVLENHLALLRLLTRIVFWG